MTMVLAPALSQQIIAAADFVRCGAKSLVYYGLLTTQGACQIAHDWNAHWAGSAQQETQQKLEANAPLATYVP